MKTKKLTLEQKAEGYDRLMKVFKADVQAKRAWIEQHQEVKPCDVQAETWDRCARPYMRDDTDGRTSG